MLEQLKYMNHLNEVFEFGKDGIFVDENNLHDYSWNVTKKNNRISALDYTVTNKSLPLVIICNTAEEGIAARNKLFEVVEKDVLACNTGGSSLATTISSAMRLKVRKKITCFRGGI